MTIGIPGGHFFLTPLHSLIFTPDFPLRHSRLGRESL